ncbi:6-phosphogluconolactonase [Opitutus sp. ER46]|uniref:6-phosphogluconolactonase n=1 Tax=Opitutus sp. ER46 TaxID=2161864 RepID=UPI000D308C90|nr:6-phosphogluconolactonase [Opitutus sp. ER46]PTY00381.1 glucosamine-6-phosphate deaminase [Opitutus sp. ER46]
MSTSPVHYAAVDRLAVERHPHRSAMGRAAARAVAAYLCDTINRHGRARIVFGCAPSQDDFLAALVDPALCGAEIDWRKVTAFHMDDYVGLPGSHPASFRSYLQRHLLSKVPVGTFHPITAEAADGATVCRTYAAALREQPIDLICLGIGENGHIAFNDPPVADFDDPALIKVVELDHACRTQQVNDGCFPNLAAVPPSAYTLTVPVFRTARRLSVVVPGPRKAAAARAALRDPIGPGCPASVLRLHPSATLYLDADSAAQL